MQKQTLLSIARATPTNTTTDNTDFTDNNKLDSNPIEKEQIEKNNQPSITPQTDNTCVLSNKEEVFIMLFTIFSTIAMSFFSIYNELHNIMFILLKVSTFVSILFFHNGLF